MAKMCSDCFCRQLFTCAVIFFTATPGLAGYTWSPAAELHRLNVLTPAPEFERFEPNWDGEFFVGETVLLPCAVANLGDKVVSWIRKRDLHILTSGRFTYTSDNRFEVVNDPQNFNFWGLRIRGVKITDTGQYECQVNTDPKMNLPLNLTVRGLPAATSSSKGLVHIRGPAEQYVREGTTVTFSCEVTQQTPFHQQRQQQQQQHRLANGRTTQPLRWAHNKQELQQSGSIRGGISIDTEYWDRKITSKLTLTNVLMQDGGLYTCSQSNSRSATVSLIVVEGEHSEAMQRDATFSTGHNGAESSTNKSSNKHIFLFCYYIFCIYLNV